MPKGSLVATPPTSKGFTMTNSAIDILTLVRADHQTLVEVFGRPARAHSTELLRELTQQLVRHEVAEELVVYPAIRTVAPERGLLATELLREQATAERLLASLEKTSPTDPLFGPALARLQADVLSHAAHEERDVLGLIERHVPRAVRAELGARYRAAKNRAPIRGHLPVPDTSPGSVMLGPVVARRDRMRDALELVLEAHAHARRVEGMPLAPWAPVRTPSTWWTEIRPASKALAEAAI